MTRERVFECSFMIPTSIALQSAQIWEQLERSLLAKVDRVWMPQGLYRTLRRDANSGQPVVGEARHFIVAASEAQLEGLKQLLGDACEWFGEPAIPLTVAGRIEVVSNKRPL